MCSRSLQRTVDYFRRVRKVELSMEGKLEFLNFWYLMIIVNDILIIIGSYMEGRIWRNVSNFNYVYEMKFKIECLISFCRNTRKQNGIFAVYVWEREQCWSGSVYYVTSSSSKIIM